MDQELYNLQLQEFEDSEAFLAYENLDNLESTV